MLNNQISPWCLSQKDSREIDIYIQIAQNFPEVAHAFLFDDNHTILIFEHPVDEVDGNCYFAIHQERFAMQLVPIQLVSDRKS